MSSRSLTLGLACCGALAASVAAQDSVSKVVTTPALPGDSVNAHDLSEQVNDFVVDQAVIRSSWGTPFGIAPLVKTSQVHAFGASFFNMAASAQAMSKTMRSGVPFARPSYMYWNAPGFGVNGNTLYNDAGTLIPSAGLTGHQFGLAFAEFGTGLTNPAGLGASLNNIVGGVVNFTDARPSRLYVSRVTAAVNGLSDDCNVSSFGMGGVDSDGNVAMRADDNGAADCGGQTVLPGNNLFRVSSLSRTAGSLNTISSTGGSDAGATTWLLVSSTVTHNTPNLVAQQIAGRPILIGSNFNRDYVFEQVAGSVVALNQAHFAVAITDHRGAVAWVPHDFPALLGASTAGTGAILAKAGGVTDRLNVWGLDANANVTGARAFALPAAIADPLHPTWTPAIAGTLQEFGHTRGATAFRGGNAPVAIGRHPSGDLLLSAAVYYNYTGSSTHPAVHPDLYLAVARVDATGAATWAVAAWTSATDGRTVFGTGGTTSIGRLSSTLVRPPLSPPMFDAFGNIWFVGGVQLAGSPDTETVGVLRAVLDPAGFGYRLELVAKQGDVLPGRNSGRNWRLDYLDVAATTSISSGTAWSGNISSAAFRNQPVAGLSASDSATLGGLLIHASVLYDKNGDGLFVRSTGTTGDPTSPDEDYRVLLYLSGTADCNANGIPDDADIAEGTAADGNGNGIPDSCEGIAGLAYCSGDGSGTACPCGNSGAPGSGCANSVNANGGNIAGTGIPSLAADTLVLLGSNMPNSSALYFQGTTQLAGGAGSVFGDGLRCVGGSIVRLRTQVNSAGASRYPGPGNPSISVRGLVTAPGTRTYQIWYRNAAAFCTTATFNLTNGLQIAWTP